MKFRRAGVASVAAVVLAGCASDPARPADSQAKDRPSLVQGDWDDLDAAVAAAASKVEMTVSSRSDNSLAPRVYKLATITDEPAQLIVRRKAGTLPGGTGKASEVLELEATVGLFGDRRQERALIEAVRERLGDLAGVDFAPLR